MRSPFDAAASLPVLTRVATTTGLLCFAYLAFGRPSNRFAIVVPRSGAAQIDSARPEALAVASDSGTRTPSQAPAALDLTTVEPRASASALPPPASETPGSAIDTTTSSLPPNPPASSVASPLTSAELSARTSTDSVRLTRDLQLSATPRQREIFAVPPRGCDELLACLRASPAPTDSRRYVLRSGERFLVLEIVADFARCRISDGTEAWLPFAQLDLPLYRDMIGR